MDPPFPRDRPPLRPVISAITALRIGAAGEQMAVLAIGGDELVAFARRQPHADDDRLLADIEMAEAADQPHAEQLPGLFLEPADQQHGAINGNFVAGAEKFGQPRIVAGSKTRMMRASLILPAAGCCRA